ncbi:MAG TPA: hypothetical protein VMW38_02215 [Terriglobia bacterium]|nr:hypothetical protein [Terriglobia bacterium]
MTNLLQEAFAKAALLPEALQDSLAGALLSDMEAEFHWDETLSKSQNVLEDLVKKALKDDEEGKTRAMGFDEL